MPNKNTIAKRKYRENRDMLYEDKYLLEKNLLNCKNKDSESYRIKLNYYAQFCIMNKLKIHIDLIGEIEILWGV